MERNPLAISVKEGLSDGSDDQHISISSLHSGSQDSGTGGLKVLFTIPPELCLKNQNLNNLKLVNKRPLMDSNFD